MTTWMIRGESGRLYDEFRERGLVAVGWNEIADRVEPGMGRKELADLYQSTDPARRRASVVAGASQVWRFVNEIQVGDTVVTYSPANRTYLVGKVIGALEKRPELAELGMPLTRQVAWRDQEVSRDALGMAAKNSLGSTLTVFVVPEHAACALQDAAAGRGVAPAPAVDDGAVEDETLDQLESVEFAAIERIKDLVSRLNWSEMQELIAGLLRAMGYKTQISPAGPDRGKDIIASPDGFGFENPRIVVEVKHRVGTMGSAQIRSFLGGRHKDDRGLYVSTGGFTRDAHYEAERAPVPLSLWTLDNVVRALVEHYDQTDAETKRLVPLKRLYVPA